MNSRRCGCRRAIAFGVALASAYLVIGCAARGGGGGRVSNENSAAPPVNENAAAMMNTNSATNMNAVEMLNMNSVGATNDNANSSTPANSNANQNQNGGLPNANLNENVSPGTGTGQTIDVSVGDFKFSPPEIRITTGDTVRWTNDGATRHSVTSGDPDDPEPGRVFDEFLGPGEKFEFTFETAGSFEYFCTYHPLMMRHAMVVVEVP